MEDPDRVFAAGRRREADGLRRRKRATVPDTSDITGHRGGGKGVFSGHPLEDVETADRATSSIDLVQMPRKVMDAHYNSFGKKKCAGIGEEGDRACWA